MVEFNATNEIPKRRGGQVVQGHVGKLRVGSGGREEQGKAQARGRQGGAGSTAEDWWVGAILVGLGHRGCR